MAKKKAFRATIARRRAARVKVKHQYKPVLKPGKNREKIHASLTYCCIPEGSIDDNRLVSFEEVDGKKVRVLEQNLDALKPYREIKEKWQNWNRKHYSGKKNSVRKYPWFMLTHGKCYNYETRTMSWGEQTSYFRVPSELGLFHNKTIIHKMTRDRYKQLLIEAKLKDWEKKNPRPIPYANEEKDMFEPMFMNKWHEDRDAAKQKIEDFVNKIGSKVSVYARYVGDTGYPRHVTEFRSDHQNLMIMDGKYANHLGSKTIQRVQRLANKLGHDDPKLVALRIVDGSQECILIPACRCKAAA